MPDNTDKSDAAKVSEIRDLLPTSLGSVELRGRIAAELRANAVFSARTGNAIYLSRMGEVIDKVAAGDMDQASARVTLLEMLRSLGYTPEGGFPDDAPGTIPEAEAGTLQDLSSRHRLDLIINTQRALMHGRGQQLRGMEPDRLAEFPAWELVRAEERDIKRKWGRLEDGTPSRQDGRPDFRARWMIAGGIFRDDRMIALKGDPVWGELGAGDNFDDALDTDHPPFAYNSGMGWREVSITEARALGVTGPDGESLELWITTAHPVLTGTQPALPVPQISVRRMDPAMIAKLESTAAATVTQGTAHPPADGMAERIAARRAAREARRAELADIAATRFETAYAAKGGQP